MRKIVRSARFRRDVKLAERRGKEMTKLREVLRLLAEGVPLPSPYRDHALGGDWKSYRECHLEPDWLLIYKIDSDNLLLARTGTHSDLF